MAGADAHSLVIFLLTFDRADGRKGRSLLAEIGAGSYQPNPDNEASESLGSAKSADPK